MDQNPQRQEIDLSNQQLSLLDSSSLLLLEKFENLQSLNLADNNLTKLP